MHFDIPNALSALVSLRQPSGTSPSVYPGSRTDTSAFIISRDRHEVKLLHPHVNPPGSKSGPDGEPGHLPASVDNRRRSAPSQSPTAASITRLIQVVADLQRSPHLGESRASKCTLTP